MAQNDFIKTCAERQLDKYKESFGAAPFGGMTAMSRAKIKGVSRVRKGRNKGQEGIISNCSEIHIETNTAAVIFSNGKIDRIITKPGVYVYYIKEPVSRNTPGEILRVAYRNTQIYGFHPEEEKKVVFVNLKEIRGIGFGTGVIPYHDKYYNLDLEVRAFGRFAVQITDPRRFIESFVPAGVYECSFEEDYAVAPLLSEISHSLVNAITKMSSKHRIAEMTACSEELLRAVRQDTEHVGAWESKYGFRITNIVLESIQYMDESKHLVDEFNEKRLPYAALDNTSEKSSQKAIKHQIAAAIYKNGFGDCRSSVITSSGEEGGAEIAVMNNNVHNAGPVAGGMAPLASAAELVTALTANSELEEMEKKIVMLEKLVALKKGAGISEEIYEKMMAQVVGL
ncbi:MAG: SPFH domain-containing protein [Dorea sp.]|nr:SPFH domain-containing protein [Dorea sp.]